jgi:hypothetical protein
MSSISNFVSAVCEVLNTNCNSLVTDNANANMWSKSTLDLGDAWLTADPDPHHQNQLQTDIALLEAKPPNPTMTLAQFFANLTASPSHYPLSMWSMDLVLKVQGVLAVADPNDPHNKDKISGWNGVITQYSTLIQSTKEQDTSTGDSENKACQSALQNASSAGQPATNAGDSILGLLSNGSSVQAQISA